MSNEAQVRELRGIVLRLHKMLVDLERAKYERQFGTVTSGQFLQLLLEDPEFTWLRKLSTLIVEIDEAFDAEVAPSPDELNAMVAQTRVLFTPNVDSEFAEKYQAALQDHPDVVIEHSKIVRILKAS